VIAITTAISTHRLANGLAAVVIGLVIIIANARSQRLRDVRSRISDAYLGERGGPVFAFLNQIGMFLAGGAFVVIGVLNLLGKL
jgi:hypothetical protein